MEGIGTPSSLESAARLLWPQRAPLYRYGVAVGLVLVVVAVKLLVPDLGTPEPEVLLTIPVVLAGLYGGFGPGIVTAALATVIGASLDPGFALRTTSPDLLGTAIVFLLRCGVGSAAAAVRYALVRTVAALRRLEELQREREAFVQVLGHELRNPLTALGGYLELARRYAEHPDRGERLPTTIAAARAETARLARLISDLELLLSVSTPHLDTASRGPVDLRGSAIRAVERARAIAGAHELALALPDVPVIVRADSDRVDQILDNLVKNALRYSPPASTVVVRVSARAATGGTVGAVSVRDAGPGVAPEERERIFERFARGSAAAGTSGSGVGLAVARELARLMDGRVRLEESSPSGSTFSLELPLETSPTAV